VVPLLVAVAALASAGFLYVQFLQVDRALWYGNDHDRNAHYLFCLRMGADVRNGQFLNLLVDFSKGSAAWPPLQGVLAAGALVVGGLDYRLAVLPSLLGYVLAAAFGFLAARRAAPAGGNLAGFVAAACVLLSPAYRAFATDIMLESLGAGLSLAALYCYLVAVQGRSDNRAAGRWLGIALTALFLHKYNYWLLVVFAMTAAEVTSRPAACIQLARDALSRVDWRRWARTQLLHPLNYVLAVLLLVIGASYANGPRPLVVAGLAIPVSPPLNLITVAFAVFFLRLALWWLRAGRAWVAGFDARLRQVVFWHLWPMAFWFLLPKHLGVFVWYVSPANSAGAKPSLLDGAAAYARWAATDYHAGLWSAVAVGVLVFVALAAWRRLRPGGHVILLFVLIAAALTVIHPSHKARHMHTWLAGAWAAAGVGAAVLTCGRLTALLPRARPWLAAAAAAGLLLLQMRECHRPGHAEEGGPHPQAGSALDVTDYYLPDLDHAHQAAVVSETPMRFLGEWTYLQRRGRLDGLEDVWFGFAGDGLDERGGFERWLQTTKTDTLVVVELSPRPTDSGEGVMERGHYAAVRDLLLGQQVFHKVKSRLFPQQACTVSVWKREAASGG
jgi:hypothetical protein